MGRSDAWFFREYGWCIGRLEGDREEEALKYLMKAEELEEADSWLNTEIGWNLGKLGKNEEAIERLKKAEEQGDTSRWLYREIAWNLGRAKNQKKLWST